MELYIIFYGILVAVLLSLVLNVIPFLINRFNSYIEQLSPYECGFDPFQDARAKFDVRFYLIALVFIIFDLEIALIFPWSVSFSFITLHTSMFMVCFLLLLFFSFIYELLKGLLK